MAGRSSGPAITCCCVSFPARNPGCGSIRQSAPSSSSIHGRAMVPGSAASSRTARSATPWRRAIPAISSASCPSRFPARRWAMWRRRSGLHRTGACDAPGRPGQALRHRQLPGGLGHHGDGRHPSRPDGADDHRRLAPVILGRRQRAEPDALHGGPARRHLADRALQRFGQWPLRRLPAGDPTSKGSIPATPTGASRTTSIPRSTPRKSATWSSRNGGAASSC